MPDLNAQVPADGVDAPEAATTNETPGVDASEATSESTQQPTDLEEARRGRDEAKARARDAEQALDDARTRIAELETQQQTRDQQLERLQTQVRSARDAMLRDRLAVVVTDDMTPAMLSMLISASGVDIEADDFDAHEAAQAVRKHIGEVAPTFIRAPRLPKIPGANNGLPVPDARKESAI